MPPTKVLRPVLDAASVHIRMHPRPANLSESRQILRVLQQFGEVATFRNLRYEHHNPAPNAAFAIYQNAESAQRAINASPIRFALERVAEGEETDGAPHSSEEIRQEQEVRETSNEWDEAAITPRQSEDSGLEQLMRATELRHRSNPDRTPTTHSNPLIRKTTSHEIPYASTRSSPPQHTTSKWFDLSVDWSRSVHQDYVERQVYYTGFTPMKSMAQEDLAKVVPHVGLSDVTKRTLPTTPNKVLEGMARSVQRMKTLRELHEEGQRERAGQGGWESI